MVAVVFVAEAANIIVLDGARQTSAPLPTEVIIRFQL
jgi:hypothetical protein